MYAYHGIRAGGNTLSRVREWSPSRLCGDLLGLFFTYFGVTENSVFILEMGQGDTFAELGEGPGEVIL